MYKNYKKLLNLIILIQIKVVKDMIINKIIYLYHLNPMIIKKNKNFNLNNKILLIQKMK